MPYVFGVLGVLCVAAVIILPLAIRAGMKGVREAQFPDHSHTE